MKRICYVVAASLDGYIAGPNGEFDWIPHDPDVDFAALAGRFDTLVMGRRSFELTLRQGQGGMRIALRLLFCQRQATFEQLVDGSP